LCALEQDEIASEYYGCEGWRDGLNKLYTFELIEGHDYTPPRASSKGGGGSSAGAAREAVVVSIFGDNHYAGCSTLAAGQLINDQGAILAPRSREPGAFAAELSERAALYAAGIEPRTNAAFVPAGEGLFAVALRALAPGEELLVSYGSRWWLGRIVDELLEECAAAVHGGSEAAAAGGEGGGGDFDALFHGCYAPLIQSVYAASASVLEHERAAQGRAGCAPRAGISALVPGPADQLEQRVLEHCVRLELGVAQLTPADQNDAIAEYFEQIEDEEDRR
jgi:hypothetical protein